MVFYASAFGADEVCPVCFEGYDTRVACLYPCRHTVCMHCTLALCRAACPLCRHDLQKALPALARRESSAHSWRSPRAHVATRSFEHRLHHDSVNYETSRQ